MQLNIHIDKGRLDWGDLEDMENAKQSTIIRVIAKCLKNPSGEYYPLAEAMKILRAISLEDIEEVIRQFGEAMNKWKEGVLPPNGGGK